MWCCMWILAFKIFFHPVTLLSVLSPDCLNKPGRGNVSYSRTNLDRAKTVGISFASRLWLQSGYVIECVESLEPHTLKMYTQSESELHLLFITPGVCLWREDKWTTNAHPAHIHQHLDLLTGDGISSSLTQHRWMAALMTGCLSGRTEENDSVLYLCPSTSVILTNTQSLLRCSLCPFLVMSPFFSSRLFIIPSFVVCRPVSCVRPGQDGTPLQSYKNHTMEHVKTDKRQ